MRAPVAIDVRGGVWSVEGDAPFDAMISLNMVHIAPLGSGARAPCRRGAPLEAGRGQERVRLVARRVAQACLIIHASTTNRAVAAPAAAPAAPPGDQRRQRPRGQSTNVSGHHG